MTRLLDAIVLACLIVLMLIVAVFIAFAVGSA